MAGNIAAAQAYITDITSEEDRAKGMGLIGAAFGLGFVIGPALGSYLLPESPYVLTVLIMLCLFFLARSVQSHWQEHRGD